MHELWRKKLRRRADYTKNRNARLVAQLAKEQQPRLSGAIDAPTALVTQKISHHLIPPTHQLTFLSQLSLHISLLIKFFIILTLLSWNEGIIQALGKDVSTRQNYGFTLWITTHLPVMVQIVGISYVCVIPFLYRRNYGWEISNEAIFVRRGWFHISHTVVFRDSITKVSPTRTLGDFFMRTARVGIKTTLWRANVYLLCKNIQEAQDICDQLEKMPIESDAMTKNLPVVDPDLEQLHVQGSLWWLRFAPASSYGYFCLIGSIAYILFACNRGDLPGASMLIHNLRLSHVRYGFLGAWAYFLAAVLVLYVPTSMVLDYIFMRNFSLYVTATGYRSVRGLVYPRKRTINKTKILGTTVRVNILMRIINGARAYAIVRPGYFMSILPPSPTHAAYVVAADIAGDDTSAFYDQLFPPASLSKYPRFANVFIPLTILSLWWVLPDPLSVSNNPRYVVIAIVTVFALWLAKDRFNNIGYGYTTPNLIIQEGSLMLKRTAIKRSLIIGWEFNQNPVQYVANMCTLWALTAEERHKIIDIEIKDAINLIKECTPGLADQFIDQKIVNQPIS